MTFKIKDLGKLEEDFNGLVDFVKLNEGKKESDDISSISSVRKPQLLFLQTILTAIKMHIDKLKPESSHYTRSKANLIAAFYGALIVVSEHARIHRIKHKTTTFKQNINEIIGQGLKVAKEDRPSTKNIAKFHSTLNALLSAILFKTEKEKEGEKEHKGFKTNYAFHNVMEPSELQEFLEISYRLEQEARKNVVDEYPITGKTPVLIHTYSPDAETPDAAVNNIDDYETLRKRINRLIVAELNDKGVGSIHQLPPVRAAQANLLQKLFMALDKLSDSPDFEKKAEKKASHPGQKRTGFLASKEKAAIIAGALHLIQYKIETDEYTGLSIQAQLSAPEKSVMYKGIGELVGAAPIPQHVESRMNALNNFLNFLLIEETANDKVIRQSLVIKEIEIKEAENEETEIKEIEHFEKHDLLTFDVAKAFSAIQVIIETNRKKVVNAAVMAANEAQAPKKKKSAQESQSSWGSLVPSLPSVSGIFSSSSSSSSSSTPSPSKAKKGKKHEEVQNLEKVEEQEENLEEASEDEKDTSPVYN